MQGLLAVSVQILCVRAHMHMHAHAKIFMFQGSKGLTQTMCKECLAFHLTACFPILRACPGSALKTVDIHYMKGHQPCIRESRLQKNMRCSRMRRELHKVSVFFSILWRIQLFPKHPLLIRPAIQILLGFFLCFFFALDFLEVHRLPLKINAPSAFSQARSSVFLSKCLLLSHG